VEASIYFRREISGITDLASLKGFPVGVKTGDQHIDQLEANGVTTVIRFQNNDAIIEAAKQHKVNVFVIDDPSALYLLKGLTAIEWELKAFSRRCAIPCRVTRLDEVTNLSDAQRTAVFRILQEALTNIARHAGATEVEVGLQAGPDQLALRIRDNGRGITAAESTDGRAIGILGMRERAQIAGGEVTIKGGAGVGTTVLVTIAVPRAAARST
jgi:signal transduction histidine kinase